ncbi:hypothetical protein HYH03_018010 [Edaphochlamys debaryana]|uniref:protein-S-isoprenylcysteine alpha-carbonyl methylesterase n=1 Tax=Edaphochlamys debaryana TaxID=47281 RepID=A0A835XGW3_9CHLO|nr:hypothetical protein HYH03_018010 [Edaphochlamys debaryana]|eukprot:KAG2483120.1 hypothetical protein HYH03_018010 [Edaphochlamys debaryana]
MSSFLGEAFKGAKADIDSAGSGLGPRLARTARVARILASEIAAIVLLAPYGAVAMSVYRRLPALSATAARASVSEAASASPSSEGSAAPASPPSDIAAQLRALRPGRDGVAVHRTVPYGPAPRNYLDVYVPLDPPGPSAAPSSPASSSAPSSQQPQQQQQEGAAPLRPVVFFVHGGVWASGETWQYAPMATRLAQAGLVVVVPTYTLYPEALAGTQVEEVSAALSWTMDNVRQYGGDPNRITATGHSAGGHLMCWALLRRAAAAEARAAKAAGAASWPPPPHAPHAPHHPHPYHRASPDPAGSSGALDPGSGRSRSDLGSEAQGSHSGLEAGDRADAAAYLLGAGGASLPSALHSLLAVADSVLHPQPGDGSGATGAAPRDAAAEKAAAAAARPHVAEADVRQPAVFVSMSAPFDIAKHYEFEQARGVHELSMMKRAMGGPAGFAAASPSVILAAAVAAEASYMPYNGTAAPVAGAPAATSAANGQAQANGQTNGITSYFKSFELLGDAIPARAGLTAGSDGDDGDDTDGAAALARLINSQRSAAAAGPGTAAAAGAAAAAAAGSAAEPLFTVAAARRLPPCVVMGSCADHMVPWHEGAELVARLQRCNVPVRHLLYNHVGHGDYVMAWRPIDLAKAEGGDVSTSAVAAAPPDRRRLLPCARDYLQIALGAVRPVAAPAEDAGPNGTPAVATAARTSAGLGVEEEGRLAGARSRL